MARNSALPQEVSCNSVVDGDSIQVNRLGDDQGGNRRRSGENRNAAGAEEVKIHSRSAYTNAARALENLQRKCVELSGRKSGGENSWDWKEHRTEDQGTRRDRIASLDGREVGKNYLRARIVRLQLQCAMESSAGRRPIPHEGMI